MTDQATRTTFSDRDFVAAVRTELAAAGRTDVVIERMWIDEDEPGYPFLLHVPVGTELSVPLQAAASFFEVVDADGLQRHAVAFAKALINLKQAEAMLVRYARDVRRAANATIAAARADGLNVLLDRISFKPTYAFHLTGTSYKDAAYQVLAAVTVRHTSFYLRPETSTIWVERPGDVAEELQNLLKEQKERQGLIADLDAIDADLIVDAITLDLLAAHGLDAADVLRRVWKKQCLNLQVEYDGRSTALSLITSRGMVTASIDLPQAFWNGEHLWFNGDERSVDHQTLVGRSLGDLVPHPAFTSRKVAAVTVRHIDHISFDLSEKFRFDADSGRIWGDERLAA